jgi:hypothetical protein
VNRRRLGIPAVAAGLLALGSSIAHAAPQVDPERAAVYFQEAARLCAAEGGKLWGVSLCGPMVIADAATGTFATNQPAPAAARPAALGLANAAMEWGGTRWTTLVWQLIPADPHARARLMIHELFHRVQPRLKLLVPDAPNNHLDTTEGRVSIQLEWRALARALSSTGAERDAAIGDALAFRLSRRAGLPDHGESERRLEINEGLAQYTGTVVASASRAEAVADAIDQLNKAPSAQTFVRTFAYPSGTAYGLLLDEASPGWRRRLTAEDDLGKLLMAATRRQPSPDIAAAERRYDGAALRATEREREADRRARVADLRRRFVDGPVVVLPNGRSNTFATNGMTPVPGAGVAYPSFRSAGDWGSLQADLVLLATDRSSITLEGPAAVNGSTITGRGWTLTLAPGWVAGPGPRPGDLRVVHERPPEAPTILVTRNVLVSADGKGRPVYETQVAIDPVRRRHLLACAFRVSASIQTVAYVSDDDGDSWQLTLEGDPREAGLDPICMFGPDGTAFVSGLGERHAGLYRSRDGGRHWLPPTEAPNVDRIFYAIDPTPGAYRDRVYVFGNGWGRRPNGERAHALEVHVSVDGGASFHRRPAVMPADHRGVNHLGNAVVLSDGKVGVIVADVALAGGAPGELENVFAFVSSDDGGATFRSDRIAAFTFPRNFVFSGITPSLAADATHGPYRDRVYAAWTDSRSGRGRIMLSYSEDKGRAWSPPKEISDGPRSAAEDNPGDFTPTLAVNQDGVVGVTWYDRREKGIGWGSRVRFTASLDGGATFLPSVAVSEQVNKPAPPGAPPSVAGAAEPERWRFIGGDTAGLAADQEGTFHAVWVDNRTGVSQVWSARISLRTPASGETFMSRPLSSPGSSPGPGSWGREG